MIYRNLASKVDQYLENHQDVKIFFKSLISGAVDDNLKDTGNKLVDLYLNPMINEIYHKIRSEVSAENLTKDGASFYIKEISVFARYNSQFLLRASKTITGFCPELAHELMRNHLEEGGERGRLPAHYIVFSSALLKDLDLFVNGYVPQLSTTRTLIWLHDVLSNSHCPSTLLGMYYATEAVAIAETEQLNLITNRLGELLQKGKGKSLPNLSFYFGMHLDEHHSAATQDGMSVELGHQEGIAKFIRQYDLFNFKLPLVLDGFLQMLGILVDQWTELYLTDKSHHKQKKMEIDYAAA